MFAAGEFHWQAPVLQLTLKLLLSVQTSVCLYSEKLKLCKLGQLDHCSSPPLPPVLVVIYTDAVNSSICDLYLSVSAESAVLWHNVLCQFSRRLTALSGK